MSLITATPLSLLLGLVVRWSARSQEQARRNAMAASTVLSARRLEHIEVQAYVTEHLARRVSVPVALEGVG
jgi:hypothetical protein